ncbi:DUF4402 domain-containing protein [Agaribacter marinus]|uniref:DUF4402 domain-containing protein n=1 Tax=Agaribacter marinus TaxID=1431249 RepID=A0AA37SVT8_9ALTE|nr:DUF4402 domain-containing protein [Agaribacter marinus]GLR70671.1 hypothetical protein GCM10007852_15790 [Agaribacter marinus]
MRILTPANIIGIYFTAAYIFPAYSQTIEQTREISFGTISVTDNSAQHQILIDQNGNIAVDDEFLVIDPPLHGVYRISGYPANVRLFLSSAIIQPQTQSTQFSPEQFTLISINIVPSIRVDSLGEADIIVGGTIQTSGSGNLIFGDTDYSSRFSITVNF